MDRAHIRDVEKYALIIGLLWSHSQKYIGPTLNTVRWANIVIFTLGQCSTQCVGPISKNTLAHCM
jgi:hypothetical protein